MTLELASVPLAFVAGVLGIMSPCVWPLVLTRNCVTIEIWVESGVTMAKARSVALEL